MAGQNKFNDAIELADALSQAHLQGTQSRHAEANLAKEPALFQRFRDTPYFGGHILSTRITRTKTMKFKLQNGNIFLNDYQMTSIKHKTNRNFEQLPVAIIIGPNTKSSGSILAISFKARPKTIFIGENTANGYTISNDFFSFGNNLFLNLSTSNSIDRNNKVYKDVVEPDIIIKGEDNFNSLKNDNKVKVAMKWLKNNSRQHWALCKLGKTRQFAKASTLYAGLMTNLCLIGSFPPGSQNITNSQAMYWQANHKSLLNPAAGFSVNLSL